MHSSKALFDNISTIFSKIDEFPKTKEVKLFVIFSHVSYLISNIAEDGNPIFQFPKLNFVYRNIFKVPLSKGENKTPFLKQWWINFLHGPRCYICIF